MQTDGYRTAIATLGLSQAAAGKFLGVEPRTSRRWATGKATIPDTVAQLLGVMVEFKITPADARDLIGIHERPSRNIALDLLVAIQRKYNIPDATVRKLGS